MLISLNQARKAGIRFVKQPHWAMSQDRLELPEKMSNGFYGPWAQFHSPQSKEIGIIDLDPITIPLLTVDMDEEIYEKWEPE